jgi:hypothetical protein
MTPEHPTFNQLQEQHDAGHQDMTVLVERSGDKISTGKYSGQRLKNGNYIVDVTTADGQAGYREVPAEALSDAKQAELAEALAGKPLLELGKEAVEAVGIEVSATAESAKSEETVLMERFDELKQGLSEKDSIALWRYATALHPHEVTSARQQMSLELQNDIERQLEAKRVMSRLSELRAASR